MGAWIYRFCIFEGYTTTTATATDPSVSSVSSGYEWGGKRFRISGVNHQQIH